ncbi:MAG TPA: hypothetical protein PLE73_01535 [Spirochaetota bacterium]|nr:hypothetical protein [Spirochaetota bacterium]HPI21845.1 hypothetical protein [Spirochaetota bacterium]HPU89027.1 hypothetical protein [Spirochaetota bacterium]
MDEKERIELIRKGNELFNKGDIAAATEIFTKTKYRDGLTRVGDYYFYQQRRPLVAFTYYKMVNKTEKINEIFERMMFALGKLIRGDAAPDEETAKVSLPPLKVSPKLKILAEEILRDQEQCDGPKR